MKTPMIPPHGEPLFTDLPMNLLRLENLLSTLGHGIIRATSDQGNGLIVVYAGEITAATWAPNERPQVAGRQAIDAWSQCSGDTKLTAETLDQKVANVLPILWSDIPFTPRIRVGHLADLKAFIEEQAKNEFKDKMVAISVTHEDHYGVALYRRGEHVLSYSDTGEMETGEGVLLKFKDEGHAFVHVQVAELSSVWMPLPNPSGWDAGKRAEPDHQPAIIIPTIEEISAEPEPTSEPQPPALVEPEVNLPEEPTPIPLESVLSRLAPSPSAPEIEEEDFDDDEDIVLHSNPKIQSDEDVDLSDMDDGLQSNILNHAAVQEEAASRVRERTEAEAATNLLRQPMSLYTLGMLSIAKRTLPPHAYEEIERLLSNMPRNTTMEEAIEKVTNTVIRGVFQTTLDELAGTWVRELSSPSRNA